MAGLIERYRDRLPFADDDPVVSLQEGSTPLVLASRISEQVGAEVWLKLEGTNPTGSLRRGARTSGVEPSCRLITGSSAANGSRSR